MTPTSPTSSAPAAEIHPDLSLVLPCYNEAAVLHNTVTRLVEAFQQRKIRVELILVDNGSKDETGAIIDQLIAEGMPVCKVTVPVNQGYGYGVLCGLRQYRGKFVGFICADGQVEAHDCVKVYEIAASATSPKLVKVRRRFRMDGFKRKVVSVFFNTLINVLFGGLGSIDINGNPKIMPREYLEKMHLESRDWFLDAEVMIKAKMLKLEVLEFNILAQMREGGTSNVRPTTCLEFLRNLWKYRIGDALPVNGKPNAESLI